MVDVAQAARVVNEFADGDRRAIDGELRDVPADVVIEPNLALMCEHEDGHSRELLGDRGEVERRVRRNGHAEIQIGEAIALLVNRPQISRDTERTTGPRGAELRKQRVNPACGHCAQVHGSGSLLEGPTHGSLGKGPREQYKKK